MINNTDICRSVSPFEKGGVRGDLERLSPASGFGIIIISIIIQLVKPHAQKNEVPGI